MRFIPLLLLLFTLSTFAQQGNLPREKLYVHFRSTLYWNPNVVSDEEGSYTVWVEGSDIQGNLGFKTMKLIIK